MSCNQLYSVYEVFFGRIAVTFVSNLLLRHILGGWPGYVIP